MITGTGAIVGSVVSNRRLEQRFDGSPSIMFHSTNLASKNWAGRNDISLMSNGSKSENSSLAITDRTEILVSAAMKH